MQPAGDMPNLGFSCIDPRQPRMPCSEPSAFSTSQCQQNNHCLETGLQPPWTRTIGPRSVAHVRSCPWPLRCHPVPLPVRSHVNPQKPSPDPSRAPASAPGYKAQTPAPDPPPRGAPISRPPETALHAFNSQAEPTCADGEWQSKRRLRPAGPAHCAASACCEGLGDQVP